MWSSALQQTTRQGIDIVSEITVLQSGVKMIAARAQTSAFEASPYLRDWLASIESLNGFSLSGLCTKRSLVPNSPASR